MKINYFTGLLFLSILFACSGNKSENNEKKSGDSTTVKKQKETPASGQCYGVKSGIVYYEPMDFMGMKSTQTLYFDDYGKKEVRETMLEGSIMGMKTRKHSISISDGKYIISFDLENMTNNKDELKKVATRMDISKNPMANMDMSSFTDQMKKQYDYKDEGTEQVAGVTGKKYSIKFGSAKDRIYGVIYKNIPLKTDMGQIKMIANKFEENASVPEDKFKVPEGYTIKDMDEGQKK